VPTCLLGRISNKDLILLSASLNAGARIVKGSDVQSEVNKGVRYMARISRKKIERLLLEINIKYIIFIGNN
jgi:hypothetical protein